MAMLTVRNVSDEVHRALRVRTACAIAWAKSAFA